MSVSSEYSRVHYAARKIVGNICQRCGASGRVHAALRPNVDRTKILIDPLCGSAYTTDPADYYALCIPCHRKLDLVEGRPYCRHGHKFTPENTLIKDGARHCRVCNRERARARVSTPEGHAAKSESDRRYRERHPITPEQRARKLELQRIRRAGRKGES